MVCLGFEPKTAGWKVYTNPLNYGGPLIQTNLRSHDFLDNNNNDDNKNGTNDDNNNNDDNKNGTNDDNNNNNDDNKHGTNDDNNNDTNVENGDAMDKNLKSILWLS